ALSIPLVSIDRGTCLSLCAISAVNLFDIRYFTFSVESRKLVLIICLVFSAVKILSPLSRNLSLGPALDPQSLIFPDLSVCISGPFSSVHAHPLGAFSVPLKNWGILRDATSPAWMAPAAATVAAST